MTAATNDNLFGGSERAVAAFARASDALLANAVASGGVPGVVAALTSADHTLYQGAAGLRALDQATPMDGQTVMWIASMTKPVVAACAMQLVEQGRIGLDDPAAKIIPELGQFRVLTGWDASGQPITRPPKTAITLRNLLTHSAGFVYDTWNPEMARYHKTMGVPRASSGFHAGLRVPLAFDPGLRWEYGINIDWAGQLVEAASGLALGEYLRQNLSEPLGMNDTAFRITPDMRARMARVHQRGADGKLEATAIEVPQDPQFEPGGGGLYSTIGDYQRFMRMILNGGSGKGNRVLQPATVALMSANAMGDLRVRMLPTQDPQRSCDAEFFPGTPKTWGLSFMINEAAAPTGRPAGSLAWAGLANTFFWIDPKNAIAGILMMQMLPFLDPQALALFTAYEKSVYSSPE